MMIPSWKRSRALDLFDRLDVTGSATITEPDLQELAEHTVVGTKADPDSVKAKAIRAGYDYLWQTVFAPMDLNGDRQVNLVEFEEGLNHLDDDSFVPAITMIATAIFNAYDLDENGSLSQQEIINWLGEYGVSHQDALAHVRDMDTNRNGTVSYKELVSAITDYYINPEASLDGHWMFGPKRVTRHEAPAEPTLDLMPALSPEF
ncbi:MAG: hypothetical protein HOQ05_12100 [Corynebacteriales bacterium]|nr:hypothetical protein [Mycobacteriales bacterium]